MSKRIIDGPEELDIILSEFKKLENLVKQGQQNIIDPIFTTEDLMQLTKASRRTIQSWRDNMLLEFSAVKGKYFYRLSSVEKMLNNHLHKMEGYHGK